MSDQQIVVYVGVHITRAFFLNFFFNPKFQQSGFIK